MTGPIRNQNVTPHCELDKIIDMAYSRSLKGSLLTEPDFVHELISLETLRDLNIEASKLYDPSKNSVKFFAGFIHNNPLVHFVAIDQSSSKTVNCCVEIGDMLLVKVLTRPDKAGKHAEVSRRAVLVQVKKSKAKVPSLIRSLTGKNGFLDTKDREQLFLYNKWPQFELKAGSKSLGCFDLSAICNAPAYPLGKYAALRDPKVKGKFASRAFWNALNPNPGAKGQVTLGRLLSDFIDDHLGAGEAYVKVLPGKTPVNGWDALIAKLTGYCSLKNYCLKNRLRNPIRVSLMTWMSDWMPAHATFMQHGPEVFNIDRLSFNRVFGWTDGFCGQSYESSSGGNSRRGMPVLIVSVSSFSPLETEIDLFEPISKSRLVEEAIEVMRKFDQTHYE